MTKGSGAVYAAAAPHTAVNVRRDHGRYFYRTRIVIHDGKTMGLLRKGHLETAARLHARIWTCFLKTKDQAKGAVFSERGY